METRPMGKLTPDDYGVHLPQGRRADGTLTRNRMLIVGSLHFDTLVRDLQEEGVPGVRSVHEPLSIDGIVLMTARLRIAHPAGGDTLVFVAQAHEAQTFAVLAHAAGRALRWPGPKPRGRIIVPGGARGRA